MSREWRGSRLKSFVDDLTTWWLGLSLLSEQDGGVDEGRGKKL